MTETARSLLFSDLHVGIDFSFETRISSEEVDRFATITGDISPLHMDSGFARARGFRDRVVHGALQVGLVSRLIGVYLPGRDCLFQQCQMSFVSPVYPGQLLCVSGEVDQLSDATQTVVLKIRITADGKACARGKVHFGFTNTVND